MTEKEFWLFLEDALERGRESQISFTRDSDIPELREQGRYIGGHSLLPKDYDKISKDKIVEMGELLLGRKVKRSTKEAVMMILAHHGSDEALKALKKYNKKPDKGLEIYAELALQECEMWNED